MEDKKGENATTIVWVISVGMAATLVAGDIFLLKP
jgi:hypothetical protein